MINSYFNNLDLTADDNVNSEELTAVFDDFSDDFESAFETEDINNTVESIEIEDIAENDTFNNSQKRLNLKPTRNILIPELSNSEIQALPSNIITICKHLSSKKIGLMDCTNPERNIVILSYENILNILGYHYIYNTDFRYFIHESIKNKTIRQVMSKPLKFIFGTSPVYNKSNIPVSLQIDCRVLEKCHSCNGGLIYDKYHARGTIQVLPPQYANSSNKFQRTKWVQELEENKPIPVHTGTIYTGQLKIVLNPNVTMLGRLYIDKTGYIYLSYRDTDIIRIALGLQYATSPNSINTLCIGVFDDYRVSSNNEYVDFATFGIIQRNKILNHPLINDHVERLVLKLNTTAYEYLKEDILNAVKDRKKAFKKRISQQKPNNKHRKSEKRKQKKKKLKNLVGSRIENTSDKNTSDKIQVLLDKQQVILDNPSVKPRKH